MSDSRNNSNNKSEPEVVPAQPIPDAPAQPAPDAAAQPVPDAPAQTVTASAAQPTSAPAPAQEVLGGAQPKNDAEKKQQEKIHNEDKRIKQLEANAKDWQKHNPGRRWEPVGNYMPNDGSEENPDLATTISAGNKDVKSPLKRSGYYKTNGQGYENSAYVKFNTDDMSVKPIKKGWHAITVKDYVNSCDFLAAQGVKYIVFDYNQANVISKSMASDAVKIMMSQIYDAGWEKHVDKNGNVLPGHEDQLKFKEPPIRMEVGKNLHDYIDRHIGAIDNKLFGKQAAKLCLRMLELERISAARLQNAPVLAGPEAVAPAPAPDAAVPPPPPPRTASTLPPQEEVHLVAQPAPAVADAAEVERKERFAATAKKLGEAMGDMGADLDKTTPGADAPKSGFFANLEHKGVDDAFTQDEIKEIKGIGMQIEKIPGLDAADKKALKNLLIEYVAASRADGTKDPVRAEMIKDKLNELAVKADKNPEKTGVEQLKLLDGKFDKAAPEKGSEMGMKK